MEHMRYQAPYTEPSRGSPPRKAPHTDVDAIGISMHTLNTSPQVIHSPPPPPTLCHDLPKFNSLSLRASSNDPPPPPTNARRVSRGGGAVHAAGACVVAYTRRRTHVQCGHPSFPSRFPLRASRVTPWRNVKVSHNFAPKSVIPRCTDLITSFIPATIRQPTLPPPHTRPYTHAPWLLSGTRMRLKAGMWGV
jgi:hypothetical protein